MHSPSIPCVLGGICLSLFFVACGDSDDSPPPPSGDQETVFEVTSASVPSGGDALFGETVSLSVTVIDADGIDTVVANIDAPNGAVDDIITLGDAGSDTYTGSFSALNSSNVTDSTLGADQAYSITFTVTDGKGTPSTSAPISMAVKPAEPPPAFNP